MHGVETVEFAVWIGVVSGVGAFRKALMGSSEFNALMEESEQTIRERLLTLAALPFDEQYENEHDTAMAAYMFALQKKKSPYLEQCLRAVQYKNCFYALRVLDGG